MAVLSPLGVEAIKAVVCWVSPVSATSGFPRRGLGDGLEIFGGGEPMQLPVAVAIEAEVVGGIRRSGGKDHVAARADGEA